MSYMERMQEKLAKINAKMKQLRAEMQETQSIDKKVGLHADLNKLNNDRINKINTIAKLKNPNYS